MTEHRTFQSRRLLQSSVALLLFTSFEGFVIPYVSSPPLGLSVHRLGALQAVLLLGFGLLWPRLSLGTRTSSIAFWLLIYSTFAILAAYMMASVWGAGNETIPLAAGPSHGSAFQETIIKVVAYSSAPTGILSFVLIFWGLRAPDEGRAIEADK